MTNPPDIQTLVRHQHAIACGLARHGLHLIACRQGKVRSPLYNDWQDYRTTASQVAQWWNPAPLKQGGFSGPYAGAAIGINCGPNNLLVIDDDTGRHGLATTFRGLAERHGDPLPADMPFVETPRSGLHFYFHHDHTADPLGNSTGTLPPKIDVRGKGGYVFAPWSFTIYGQYGDLHPRHIVNAPPVPKWLRAMLPTYSDTPPSLSCAFHNIDLVRQLLTLVSASDCSRDEWVFVLMAIHEGTGGSYDGLQLAHEWSSSSDEYDPLPKPGEKAHVIDYYWSKFKPGKSKHPWHKNLQITAERQLHRGLNTRESIPAGWAVGAPKIRDPNAKPVKPSWEKLDATE